VYRIFHCVGIEKYLLLLGGYKEELYFLLRVQRFLLYYGQNVIVY